jgi:hypothetical protein
MNKKLEVLYRQAIFAISYGYAILIAPVPE